MNGVVPVGGGQLQAPEILVRASANAVFAAKSCATCHNDSASGAPKLGKGKDAYSDITMVAALWDHGPQMLDSMTARKLAWPRFTAQEMEDVIAYLNSL